MPRVSTSESRKFLELDSTQGTSGHCDNHVRVNVVKSVPQEWHSPSPREALNCPPVPTPTRHPQGFGTSPQKGQRKYFLYLWLNKNDATVLVPTGQN